MLEIHFLIGCKEWRHQVHHNIPLHNPHLFFPLCLPPSSNLFHLYLLVYCSVSLLTSLHFHSFTFTPTSPSPFLCALILFQILLLLLSQSLTSFLTNFYPSIHPTILLSLGLSKYVKNDRASNYLNIFFCALWPRRCEVTGRECCSQRNAALLLFILIAVACFESELSKQKNS